MLNQLSKEIYQANKEKGFYDKEKNIGEMLCLIHSEVSEALECDREEKFIHQDKSDLALYGNMPDLDFKIGFESNVKDTFQDEMADN